MTVQKLIDLAVYRRNLEHIVQTMAPARVMAVVKADAYGHGLIPISETAISAGIELLGVLDIETGLELRGAGVISATFAWLHSPQSNFDEAIEAEIELSASSLAELNSIAAAKGVAKVHLKIDSGLSRNGCRIEDWPELVSKAMELHRKREIDVVAIWSHLSGTSKDEDLKSIDKFVAAHRTAVNHGFNGYRHIAASPAAFSLPESRFDLVRIGVSAFGTSPVDGVAASEFGLQSPMSVCAQVIADGEISIGFLHGYFSSLSNRTRVVIGGQPYRVLEVGSLSSRIESGDYSLGDSVEVFGGKAISAEELCKTVGTVTDELFTGMKADSVSYAN